MPIITRLKSVLLASLLSSLLACGQNNINTSSLYVPTVSTDQLITHTKTISTEFFPRDYQHIDNLNKTADYVKQQLKSHTKDVSEQTFEVKGKTYRNIIARFGPKSGELIVVGAHYDACGTTYGADDNASGVAGLLELARLLKENPPKTSIELVAYSLEEPPFFATQQMGSAFHAKLLKETHQNIKLMLSLEMIGYFKDEANSQDFPLSPLKMIYGNQANFIAVIGNFTSQRLTNNVKNLMKAASDLPVYALNAPAVMTGIDYSDHRNYWNEGFDALMITDTSFYRNPHYHESLGDTWESLDYQRMAKVIQGVYVVIQHLE